MPGDTATEVSDLRDVVEILIQGLRTMLGIQAQHGSMLEEILTACTADPEEPSPLVELLKSMVAADEAIQARLLALPAAVARAVMDGELSGRG